MCLVHKQSISTQFFKGNKVIFSALVVQLIQLCLHCFLRAFQLLDRETISVLFFQFSDTIYDFMVLLLQNITLPLNRHWNLLKLTVSNHNGIKIPGCNSAAEALAILCFKVLLCCNQNVGRRIQLQILCRPLFRQVIRHNNQRFSAQSKPFALLSCGNNFEGLPCPHNVCQQRIASVENVCNCVQLVLPQLDFRVHTHKVQMTAIILTRAQCVELLIVEPAQPFSSRLVLPDPVLKRLLDQFLLALCDCSFLLIQDRHSLAVFILDIVKHPHISQIQRFLNDFIGIHTICTIGAGRVDIAAVIGLALYIPPAGVAGIMHFYLPLRVIRRVQQLIHEFLNHIFWKPCCSKSNRNLTCGQIRRLNFFQSRHIHCEYWIAFSRSSSLRQFFTHIARKVLICGKVFRLTAVLLIKRIPKNNAAEVCKDFFFRFPSQLHHIRHIDLCLFAHGNRQSFRCGINADNFGMLPDCALAEHICLTHEVSLIIQNFQGRKQAEGTVISKNRFVCSGIDAPILLLKCIVQGIQVSLFLLNHCVRVIFCLIFDQLTDTLADCN